MFLILKKLRMHLPFVRVSLLLVGENLLAPIAMITQMIVSFMGFLAMNVERLACLAPHETNVAVDNAVLHRFRMLGPTVFVVLAPIGVCEAAARE